MGLAQRIGVPCVATGDVHAHRHSRAPLQDAFAATGEGFVQVADAKTLRLPDRPGNNRLDSFRNILSGAGEVGLLFFVPGIDDALRLNGRARLTDDPALLASMVEFGKPPRTVVEIAVREVYLHCPKAMMRAGPRTTLLAPA